MHSMYVNNEHILYWANHLNLQDVEITMDFGYWISLGAEHKKLSLIDINEDFESQEFRDHLHMICDVSDLTVLFLLEFTDDNWCREFDRPTVTFVMPGRLNWHLQSARQVPTYQGFIFDLTDFYRTRLGWLDRLHQGPKPRYFDALLGRRKWHRTQIHQHLDATKNIVTYFGDDDDRDIRARNGHEFQWPTEVLDLPQETIDFTMQRVLIDDHYISLSMLLPLDIYNQTYYSLVAETIIDNRWSFFTEKIAKPILAGRLFLVVSGQHYLRNLREMGFRTFNDIIDESYDEEPDSQIRIEMVLEQADWLMQQDPQEILRQAHPILQYNQRHLMSTPWEQKMLQGLRRNIDAFVSKNTAK